MKKKITSALKLRISSIDQNAPARALLEWKVSLRQITEPMRRFIAPPSHFMLLESPTWRTNIAARLENANILNEGPVCT